MPVAIRRPILDWLTQAISETRTSPMTNELILIEPTAQKKSKVVALSLILEQVKSAANSSFNDKFHFWYFYTDLTVSWFQFWVDFVCFAAFNRKGLVSDLNNSSIYTKLVIASPDAQIIKNREAAINVFPAQIYPHV